MFQLLTPTAAALKSVTPRTETHGDDLVVAISMRLAIEGPNTLLDVLSPKLRHALYMAAPGQEDLPGVEPSTPLLRFNAFEQHVLKACYEGWTLKVDHGIDENEPIALGGCKVDAFRIAAKEGGTVVLSFRVGSNDVSAEEIGMLCGKLGSEISITLHAPEKPADAIDGTQAAFDMDHPGEGDATDLFAQTHAAGDVRGPDAGDDADSEGGETDAGDIDPPIVTDLSRARTARGRERTRKAIEAREGAVE